jgi:ribosomal protein S18 acetylase RimI-like enzyme
MHQIRLSVRENTLSNPDILSVEAYQPYIEKDACWVAIVDQQITGFAALDIYSGTVWALFVSPAFEGQGIGKRLMEALIHSATNSGLDNVRLSTEAGSRAASFYRNAGWRHIGQSANVNEDLFELDLSTA